MELEDCTAPLDKGNFDEPVSPQTEPQTENGQHNSGSNKNNHDESRLEDDRNLSRNQRSIAVACEEDFSSAAQNKFHEENPMWTEIMKSMHCVIDNHILLILDIYGYRSYQALKDLDESDIKEIEENVRSGDLLDRVETGEIHLYLGKLSDPRKFKFLPGEKKLIRRMVQYIQKNHQESDKPLGKNMNMYPLFKKKRTPSNNHVSGQSVRSEVDTVVTTDIRSEVKSIRRLIKDYFSKNSFSDDYSALSEKLTISVKTVEKESGDASVACYFTCPLCGGKTVSGGYRERKSTWTLSNLHRHFMTHKKKGDKIPGTVDTTFFQRRSINAQNTSLDVDMRDSDSEDTPAEIVNITSSPDQSNNVPSVTGNEILSLNNGSKLSSIKYGRDERRKRALGVHSPNQIRITVYFTVLNEVEMTLKANAELIMILKARCEELSLKASNTGQFNMPSLLKMLMDSAIKNCDKKNHGQRYEEEIKLFAAYLFIVGGRYLYEMLLANLSSTLPSISVVERTLNENSNPVFEGVFRFQELRQFLIAHNLPLKVCISEDGTRVQQHFTYDPSTNQIVGPVLPLADNGVPICKSFPATSAAMITHHLQNKAVASSGYAFMAQPLQKGAPSFCLALFGTDNKFTSEHCFKRWTHIYEELKKIGIEVLVFASDGDPKLLSAMHSQMFKVDGEVFENIKDFHFATKGQSFTVIQDPIHTANKFKTRLSPAHFLPIGNFSASQTHLRELVKNQGKDKHGLTESDLDKEDKMNFNASLKISSERVTDLMKATVPGSEATVAYLTNMRYLIEACLDDSLSPSEVLYKIWHTTYFLRYWKTWLLNHSKYKMENFVTSNLYLSVEVIAHALVNLIIKLRNENLPELLVIQLFSSQPCETFFRLARSMTTTQHTVINFNLKEFLSKVRRVDLLQYITCQLSDQLVFPREKRKKLLGILSKEKLRTSYLPSDTEICEIVEQAKADAASVLRSLGVTIASDFQLKKISSYLHNSMHIDESTMDVSSSNNYQSCFDEDDIPLDLIAAFPSPDEICSLDPTLEALPGSGGVTLSPESIYVMVPQSSGGFVQMRKSTFCWLLSSVGSKLSSDRLLRVRQNICFGLENSRRNSASTFEAGHQAEVRVGDWCIFMKVSKFYVTQILGFTYLSGSGASRQYTLLTAPTEAPKNGKKARGLGCLCTWYTFNQEGKLSKVQSTVQGYVNIAQYVATISPPSCQNSNLKISNITLSFLNRL